jgi:hypothetical protein
LLEDVSYATPPLPAQEAAAFIAAEERKREERYGYFPKLHPSEYMDEPEDRNFCPRCGKRRGGDVNYIHTCTPPQEKT